MTYGYGLDPGKTTGVALGYWDDTTPLTIKRTWQIPNGLDGFLEWAADFDEDVAGDVFVCEDFILRPGVPNADITPAFIIGAVKALGLNPVMQAPSLKSLVSDNVLRRAGLWEPGKRHSNDARIHLAVYLRNQGHAPTLNLLFPRDEG